MDEKDIITLIKNDEWMMEILRATKSLDLPDWWIGAGFIRGKIWDHLHNYSQKTPPTDIDVIYFDESDFSSEETKSESTKQEKLYELKLKKLLPEVNWSVTNQARMHIFHNHKPYKSASEGLSNWVETATCIGVRLNKDNNLTLTAPHGIDDLVNLTLRPTPNSGEPVEKFISRIENKKWLTKWPKLKVVSS